MDDALTIENVIQFIVLVSGLFAGFIRFNNKTEKNGLMITQLEKDIKSVKTENKENYSRLEEKISDVEDDLKRIASDIGEIKGFIKQLSK
jgi:septal ring factor EnvC (AmiA/AmiB activator)|tara:strand:+ start:2314 stop:2583 length:270 start_codon:yes stop_codon:yes gene_type:complete